MLVNFSALWCGYCKKFNPIYDELAQELLGNTEIVLARIEAPENPIRGLELDGYPELKLYRKGDKDPINYEGERTKEALLEFLKTNSKAFKDLGEL